MCVCVCVCVFVCIYIWVYGLPKEIVRAIMMVYKNMKTMVHASDGDTDGFGIVAEVLQGDTLASYLFIICLDYVFQMLIDLIKKC